jgi:hypothetical protein
MNDQPHSPPDDTGAARRTISRDRARAVDASRRRLVRSGLGGSVVLGSLVSKPVLGAEYICTVSGHASGNASAHPTDVNCRVGQNVAAWLLSTSWPTGITRGTLPKPQTCSFTGQYVRGTNFNGFMSLAATFYYSTVGGSGCAVRTTQGSNSSRATLLQVLATTNTDEVFRLGRAVVASLLNAAQYPSYPVSAARVVAMFNAVKDGGVYHVDGANLNLTRLGVIQYLETLY